MSNFAATPIPPDDLSRDVSIIDPDDPSLLHLAVVGDTYTILLSGEDTAGRYCLIDMHVPIGGGPGPHRHDFEEMFHVLEGEIEFYFRGKKISPGLVKRSISRRTLHIISQITQRH